MAHFQEFWKSVMANSELFGLLQVIMGEEGIANSYKLCFHRKSEKDLCLRMEKHKKFKNILCVHIRLQETLIQTFSKKMF